LRQSVNLRPEGVACHSRGSNSWTPTTWRALAERVHRLAASFRSLGLEKGERLAILSRTSLEWCTAELAALQSGAVVVGIDPQGGAELADYVLRHSGASAVVADSAARLSQVSPRACSQLKFTVLLDAAGANASLPKAVAWSEVLFNEPAPFTESIEAVAPDDPASLVYTSGTAGTPKGIEYTHRQLLVACQAIDEAFPQFGDGTAVCWLPMAHLFQRMLNLVAMARGLTTYFVEDPRQLLDCLRVAQPTVFAAVPRFYEKIHETVAGGLAQARGLRGWLARAALSAGAEWSCCDRAGERPGWWLSIKHAALDRLVLSRLREIMGARIEFAITGSAPTAPWLLEFFHGIGLLVLEAYGLSENTVPVATNLPGAYRFGSVGRPLPPNDVRLGEDGEVLVKGPGLFRGYYREQEAPDCFTPDGYYRTGDLGQLDKDGYLFLVGRKSEIIKTSTGRRIAPARVEEAYRQSRYLEQVIVFGEGRKQLCALVSLNAPAVEEALVRAGVSRHCGQTLSEIPFVENLIRGEFDALGRGLAPHEQVRRFAILAGPLTVDAGELTPTLKLRRAQIAARYADLLRQLQDEGATRPQLEHHCLTGPREERDR
jgi:long-chain acyl-CoA synthetase